MNKKIVQINATCGVGSTGRICVDIRRMLTGSGIENYIFYSSGASDYPLGKKYMTPLEVKFQALKSRIFGNYGFQSKSATKRLIEELDKISPDVVHLHNIHGHNVHLGILFDYLKEKETKVIWTFHDCWAFTGYCPHYTMAGCSAWKENGCIGCPQRKHFSWFVDRSNYLFEKKKKLFTDIDLTVVTPSQWLADQVKCSFLKNSNIKVINNGIDLSVFYPRESEFRKKYGIQDKFIILGVAFGWSAKKGLDIFISLSEKLDKHFQIVLVGTNDEVDKELPENIISIHRTQSQTELAEVYSAADVFVNPTREDNYPTVNMESIACGTPVITFCTGGSPESIDEKTGIVVKEKNCSAILTAIENIRNSNNYTESNCVMLAKRFDKNLKYQEYLDLYNNILNLK